MTRTSTLLAAASLLLPAAVPAGEDYVVLVDPGPGDEYLRAAEDLAAARKGTVHRFPPKDLEALLAPLREARPRFAVFVLPPDEIDVDLCHAVLELSTRVDDDPFPDFEYGFVTGRDGEAARRFVARAAAASRRQFGRKGAMMGTWGATVPPLQPMTATRTIGLDMKPYLISSGLERDARRKAVSAALASFRGLDVLSFFSHGFPDQMVGCFSGKELLEWKVDLAPAILINCACFNGAPARWLAAGPRGVDEQPAVARDDSVALAVLDSGVSAYFAGIDSWHGPLANQVFGYVVDDGLRLGEAAKRMADRLALDFLPGRIKFPPARKWADRFAGEGPAMRRGNAAGMIFYGDPSLAPFAKGAGHAFVAEVVSPKGGKMSVRIKMKPILQGFSGPDAMFAQHRLIDYFSVKGEDWTKELAAEVYRVVPLPAGRAEAPKLKVRSAKSGKRAVPAGDVQAVVEETPAGKLLHVRVPLKVRAEGTDWLDRLARNGINIELDEE